VKTILGIETSCDETSAAVVEEGERVRSVVTASQDDLHRRFGGVVPEIASRAHLQALIPAVEEALARGGVAREEIDAVAVSFRPGLAGSLLLGLTFAKAFAYARGLPLVGVDHLHAHVYAAALEHRVACPVVGLVVSGGHTALFYSEDLVEFELLGSTIDDAAGEAFDKVAAVLGLGYPGGPAIDRAAREGDPRRFSFPRTFRDSPELKFSFSGIKTAVRYHCQGHSSGKTPGRRMSRKETCDVAASFQEAVVDVLAAKLEQAVERTRPASVVIGGGVACNSRLRERIRGVFGGMVLIPAPRYCMDNAAMIAGLGCRLFEAGVSHDLTLDVDPRPVRAARIRAARRRRNDGRGTGTASRAG